MTNFLIFYRRHTMFPVRHENPDFKRGSPGIAWINPAKRVGKHLKPTDRVNKDRAGLIREVIEDINRRFEHLFIQLSYEFLSGEVWGWTRRRKNEQRCKIPRVFDCLRLFLLNDGRRVNRLSCYFCYLHVANLGGSCAQGRTNTCGGRTGTTAGNI